MSSTGEGRPRRRFDPAFVILGMGLLLLANVLVGNRPTVADVRPVDLLYLLSTGACLGAGLVAVAWYFDARRKG